VDNVEPRHIVDELIAEKSHALKLTEAELSKLTHETATPLTDNAIQSLLLFSVDFQAHLAQVEQSFEGWRTVIDGLDVRVTVLRKGGEGYLKLSSLLHPLKIAYTTGSSTVDASCR